MSEVTQADKTTLDRACTEWCMGEPSIAYQIMADYRIQARREALEEAAAITASIGEQYGEDETGWLDCSETIAAAIRNLVTD